MLIVETSKGRNAWYEAKESTGDMIVYMADLARAWRMAESAYDPADREHSGRSIGLQCRYALVNSSINSLAQRIPPLLLAELVRHGERTPEEGLAYARQIPSSDDRALALTELLPYLDELRPKVLPEALAATRAIQEYFPGLKVRAFVRLAPHLPEPKKRTQVLCEALTVMQTISDYGERLDTLAKLAPCLRSEPLLRAALEVVSRFKCAKSPHWMNERWNLDALVELAPYLQQSELLLQESLAVAQKLGTEGWVLDSSLRALALARLAPYLTQPLKEQALSEALEVAQVSMYGLQKVPRPKTLGKILGAFWCRLRKKTIEQTPEWERIEWSSLKVLPRDLESPTMRGIQDMEKLAEILASLGPQFSGSLKKPLLNDALVAARRVKSKGGRAKLLAEIASRLPEPRKRDLLEEAWTTARSIYYPETKVRALAALVPHLSGSLKKKAMCEALREARVLREEDSIGRRPRIETLKWLIPEAAKLGFWKDTLTAARSIKQTREWSSKVLPNLLAILPPGPIESETLRKELHKALKPRQKIRDKGKQVKTLMGIVPFLARLPAGKVLGQTLMWLNNLKRKRWRTVLLTWLVSRLPTALLRFRLTVTRVIQGELRWERAVERLAPSLSEPLLWEVLSEVQEIESPVARASILTRLAPRLAELDHTEKALMEVGKIEDEVWRARAPTREVWRARTLTGVAFHLSQRQRSATLEVVWDIIHAIESRWDRWEIVKELAPVLAKLGTPKRALVSAREIPYSEDRVEALRGIVPFLLKLDPADLYPLWCETLRILAERNRADLLSDLCVLAPVIIALGGPKSIVETFRAIQDVGRWWP